MNLTEYITTHPGVALRKPYLIAEAGVNHEGSMDLAKRLINEAKEGGADAIKFQTYKAHLIASKNSPSYWDLNSEPTTSQFELFQKYDKFWKTEYEALKVECDKVGIEFLSTPFDVESVHFLNDLMDVFKVSSSDLNNSPFIQHMCQYGKPILLSVGASYMDEVKHSVDLIKKENIPVSLMHCILNYPTEDKNANLGMILDLKENFEDIVIGYSDHTLPKDMNTLVTSVTLGASILEKHFTHDKTLPGNDHYHAMDKEDIKIFKSKINDLFTLLGSFERSPIETEEISRKNARRSLIAASEIKAGETITAEQITWKRPAFGISPTDYDQLIGSTAKQDIAPDEILQWDMFSK